MTMITELILLAYFRENQGVRYNLLQVRVIFYLQYRYRPFASPEMEMAESGACGKNVQQFGIIALI